MELPGHKFLYPLLNIMPRSNRSRALQFLKPCIYESSFPVPSSAMTRDRSSTVYRQCMLVRIWRPGTVPRSGATGWWAGRLWTGVREKRAGGELRCGAMGRGRRREGSDFGVGK